MLDGFLRDEGLQQGARRAFETLASDGLGPVSHVRRTIVASRLTGPLVAFEMAALKDNLREVARHLDRLDGAIGDLPEPPDPFERDRFLALRARARDIAGALVMVGWDLYELDHDRLTPAAPELPEDGTADGTGDTEGNARAAKAAADTVDERPAVDGAPAKDDEKQRKRRRVAVDDGPSNQLVWLEEIPSDRPITSVSDLRFRVWSSPSS